ncbi:TPA: hypothetical protein ACKWS1_004397 [Yersinia enterocolitica]
MNGENKTDGIYLRKGVGNKTFCVTCQKTELGYLVLFEKKLKIRSKKKICDETKSTSRKPVFSSQVGFTSLDLIDYDAVMSLLPDEEKAIFVQLVDKIAEGFKND